ncbi:hypothetical protein KA075_02030, partial [Candidatus Saccharibacteria bacterium]|nr:hypothetical protein [Candidatus Saccharibacteria bacterium]
MYEQGPAAGGTGDIATQYTLSEVLDTASAAVSEVIAAEQFEATVMGVAALVLERAAPRSVRIANGLRRLAGSQQSIRDMNTFTSAIEAITAKTRDDGTGGRNEAAIARRTAISLVVDAFVEEEREQNPDLLAMLAGAVHEVHGKIKENPELGGKLASAAFVVTLLANSLPSVGSSFQGEVVDDRPLAASAPAFPTSPEARAKAKAAEEAEAAKQAEVKADEAVKAAEAAKEKQEQRPARAVAIGDSVTSMTMNRDDVAGKTQTHEIVEDKWGKSQVGAQPDAVLEMLKEWNETKGFDGVEVQVSTGAANNPAGIEKALPKMIDEVAGSGALGMVIIGVPQEPPKDGIYQEAGALMREYDTNNQMAEIVRQAQDKHPDFKITFTGGYKTGPDNLHPSDSELDALRQTDAMQKIRAQQVADYTAAVERAEAKEQADNLAVWNKAVADAENVRIWNEAAAEARAEEEKKMGFDESLIGDVKVKVNPESKSSDLSPEVVAFNDELRRLVETGEQDISALSLLYQAVYNANDTGEAPEGYVKVFLPHEVKGLLPQLTVAAKTSPSEMYTRPEMAAATYLTALKFSKLIAEKYPQYTGQMIRARDYNSANHGSHNSGLDWDISVAKGYAPTEVSDGSALDFAGLAGAGEYDRDLTIDLIVIMGQIQAWDGDLFKYLLYEDQEALAAANGILGRTFVQMHEYHSDHGHAGINRERSLAKFHPKPPWTLETDLYIGGGAVPLTAEEKKTYDEYMEWIANQTAPLPTEAPVVDEPEAPLPTEAPVVDEPEAPLPTEAPVVDEPEAPLPTEAPVVDEPE